MGCIFQAIAGLFVIWLIVTNPVVISGFISAISQALKLISIIIIQIINSIS